MQEVQVLEATRTAPNSRGRVRSNPITVERIRVAAYVRVSTDDDDQLGSFESQKLYYEEKIGENPEWVNAGIFADEAITGTKTDKRTGFQEMINRCLNGEIDLILTKSISRFARNTLDTLQYSRMLTDIDKIMPPVSRFGGGNRANKKKTVINRLKAYFDKFYGIGGAIKFTKEG